MPPSLSDSKAVLKTSLRTHLCKRHPAKCCGDQEGDGRQVLARNSLPWSQRQDVQRSEDWRLGGALSLGIPEGFVQQVDLTLRRPMGQSALLRGSLGAGVGRNAQSRKPDSILNHPDPSLIGPGQEPAMNSFPQAGSELCGKGLAQGSGLRLSPLF